MLFKIFLAIHIISAGISLLAGAIAASTVKGGKIHKRSGRLFVPGMIVATISAIVLSRLNPNLMLMGIGVFSLYLTLSGWVWAKRSSQSTKNKQSKILGILALGSGLFLVAIALTNWPKLNIVALVFGLLNYFLL